MGSIKPAKTKRGYFGKVITSLNEELKTVEWGEFKVGDLFEKLTLRNKNSNFNKLTDTSKVQCDEFDLPLVNAKVGDNGIMFYGRSEDFESEEMTIGVISNGAIATGTVYAQPQKTGVLWDAYLLKSKHITISKSQLLYLSVSLQKSIKLKFGWEYKAVWSKVQKESIQLPVKDGKPDFEFMESFIAELEAERIAELEAYLDVTGLSDCELTDDEIKALDDFSNDDVEWGEFSYQSLFNNIQQGRRLKKDDQKSGNLPFVMSGVTNTGIINHIANPVFRFPKNSITVDIFGNAFYRNYDFGAGDDTGVYWNTEKELSKSAMLFIASSLQRSIFGKFSYGKKLRSSQSLNFQAMLPSMNSEPDYSSMELLISAIQKIVIKDVVEYADTKIEVHKEVIHS